MRSSKVAARPSISHSDLLELIPEAFIGIDEHGEVVLANSSAESLFGYGIGELPGRAVEALLSQRFADAHREEGLLFFADPHSRPNGFKLEMPGRRHDGAEFPALVTLSSIEFGGRQVATAAVQDVSERAVLAREREMLQEGARREHLLRELHNARRLESLSELAGGIAHDFNNLLAVIINYSAFVADAVGVEPQSVTEDGLRATRADVEQISLAAEQASQLTAQLLTFARREVVIAEPVDANTVVRTVAAMLTATLGWQMELQCELAPELQPITIDVAALERVLVSLALNARDAMSTGGTLTIDTANVELDELFTELRPDLSPGPHVRLRVSDDGHGMPREVAERAFDPLFTTKAGGGGLGLGLSTVYGIVEQAGGRARIYSEEGVGTTFTALFPAADPTAIVPQRRIDPAQLRGDATVMLVEDDPGVREMTRRVLAGAGYLVIACADGDAAIAAEAAHRGRIDLLLTDVIMPGLSGPKLADQITAQRRGIEVILMSGFAGSILDSHGHVRDGTTLIEKPISGPMLLSTVGQVLSGAAPTR
jgi:PAS domain S-box-containing protein